VRCQQNYRFECSMASSQSVPAFLLAAIWLPNSNPGARKSAYCALAGAGLAGAAPSVRGLGKRLIRSVPQATVDDQEIGGVRDCGGERAGTSTSRQMSFMRA
jgi:hypothetical protein